MNQPVRLLNPAVPSPSSDDGASPAAAIVRRAATLALASGTRVIGFAGGTLRASTSAAPPEACEWKRERVFVLSIPRTSNSGVVFALDLIAEIVFDAARRFGGVTVRDVAGMCVDLGVLETDWLVELEVWTNDEVGVLALAGSLAWRLEQRVVAVRELPIRVQTVGPVR